MWCGDSGLRVRRGWQRMRGVLEVTVGIFFGILGFFLFFFFNDPATTEIYTLSLHDALPIYCFPLVRPQNPMPFRFRICRGKVLRRLP